MTAADEAYDRLHGVDGHTQAVTPRYTPEALTVERVSDWRDSLQLLHDLARGHDYADARDLAAGEDAIAEVCDVLTGVANQVAEHQRNALEMSRKAEQAERRAEGVEAEVERLRDVLAEVRRVFDLQCPPMPAEKYVDRGAWMAHSWWNTALGLILNLGEVGTGAGDGATGQVTGAAWVNRSTDCPEAPAQAHLLGPDGFTRLAGECSGLCGEHHWLDRPESDTRECLICGTEVAG